jgi:hypothetical protein
VGADPAAAADVGGAGARRPMKRPLVSKARPASMVMSRVANMVDWLCALLFPSNICVVLILEPKPSRKHPVPSTAGKNGARGQNRQSFVIHKNYFIKNIGTKFLKNI